MHSAGFGSFQSYACVAVITLQPCLVTFCHSKPEKLLKTGVFTEHEIPGIYTSVEEMALEILAVTSRLPQDPKYNWLRQCGRAPKPRQGTKILRELQSLRELTTFEEELVMEANMTVDAYSNMTIRELAAETVRLLREQDHLLQVTEHLQKEKEHVLQEKEHVLQEKESLIQAQAREIEELRKRLNEG